MRNTLLSSCAIAVLSGCVIDINGGKWPDGLGDTGDMPDLEEEETSPEYRVTPDQLYPGSNEVLTVETDAPVQWHLLASVTAIGDLEIMDYKSDGAQLWVGVVVPDEALDGPAHLIFEFADGQVHFAREAVFIDAVEEEVEEDTGLVNDEPVND